MTQQTNDQAAEVIPAIDDAAASADAVVSDSISSICAE